MRIFPTSWWLVILKPIVLREERRGPSEGRVDPHFPQKEDAWVQTTKISYLSGTTLKLQAIKNVFAYFVFCNKVFNVVIHFFMFHYVLFNLSPLFVVIYLFYGNIALRPRPSSYARERFAAKKPWAEVPKPGAPSKWRSVSVKGWVVMISALLYFSSSAVSAEVGLSGSGEDSCRRWERTCSGDSPPRAQGGAF